MGPIHKYEANKGVGDCRRYAKVKNKSWPIPKEDHDLRLVGLRGHGALGNARKEYHGKQGSLLRPVTPSERS
ncbi:hypothetical protein TNCT_419661 [Trichonephila clavata]|uniref:Uncharacterized protein n=1 Tax=Trichonephila clavata TaxID=2740835 RepID=A0A8X6M6S4_TRICU|nr:hypothetical protein TNCT_419661 [Trichonephila clavata]